MPPLIYLQRKWIISSDDFLILLGCQNLFKALYISSTIFISLFFSLKRKLAECEIDYHPGDRSSLSFYLACSYVILIASSVCELLIINHSLSGSILDHRQRLPVVIKHLNTRLIAYIFQIFAFLCGVTVLAMAKSVNRFSPFQSDDCSYMDPHYFVIYVLSSLNLTYHVLEICAGFMLYLTLSSKLPDEGETTNSPAGHHFLRLGGLSSRIFGYSRVVSTPSPGDTIVDASTVWKKRCSCMCQCIQLTTCNMFGGSNVAEDLEAVGEYLTDVFRHEGILDIVFTDILAGIILLRHRQRSMARASISNISFPNTYIDIENQLENHSRSQQWQSNQYNNISNSPLIRSSIQMGAMSHYRRNMDAMPQVSRFSIDSEAFKQNLFRYSVYSVSVYSCMLRLYVRTINLMT